MGDIASTPLIAAARIAHVVIVSLLAIVNIDYGYQGQKIKVEVGKGPEWGPGPADLLPPLELPPPHTNFDPDPGWDSNDEGLQDPIRF